MMHSRETRIITRQEVAGLLEIEACMNAVENAFKLKAEGKVSAPKLLGIHVPNGGFHIKAGVMHLRQDYFVSKINANFPTNMKENGLPTIQGVIAVFDADNGRLLSLIDSIEITIIRTGAATGIATKYLARQNASVATICGCGNQGRISLKAIRCVRDVKTVYAYDIDPVQRNKFVEEMSSESNISIIPIDDLRMAVRRSDILVTCTPSKMPFVRREDISSGTFIAAVGSDSEDKQELQSSILAGGKLVVDLVEQAATIGELHHALKEGIIDQRAVHAELGDIIAGLKEGRRSDDEVIIFDSTGTALQDVAAAAIVFEKALTCGKGLEINLAN